jgi:hypothetical protein
VHQRSCLGDLAYLNDQIHWTFWFPPSITWSNCNAKASLGEGRAAC